MATFTLEYWIDDDWYVGRLREVPGIFSQGETLEELKENVRDAYRLMTEDQETPTDAPVQTEEIQV
jgi:predicted RNase H-like HicB family nuclease